MQDARCVNLGRLTATGQKKLMEKSSLTTSADYMVGMYEGNRGETKRGTETGQEAT